MSHRCGLSHNLDCLKLGQRQIFLTLVPYGSYNRLLLSSSLIPLFEKGTGVLPPSESSLGQSQWESLGKVFR